MPIIKIRNKGLELDCLVDDEDFEELNKYKWCLNNNYVGRRKTLSFRKSTIVYMHRELIPSDKHDIDHINRNKLDNRKENLRACSRSENMRNTPKRGDNTSGYKGVTFDHRDKCWYAQITVNRKHHYLGRFKNIHDAAAAFNKKALELQGEFALLNKISL